MGTIIIWGLPLGFGAGDRRALGGSGAGHQRDSAPDLDLVHCAIEVTPKVHLLTTPDDYFGPAIGNVILIEQSNGFVVVDSGLNAANGRAVVRYAARSPPSRSRR